MMFSLHIDTARGWRGGQSQVLHIVQGLRAMGHRAALVAHPGGELRRRMSEGHDLIPIAMQGEIDLSAAWRLSRVLKTMAPDVIHAHDPHAVAMASTALSIASPRPRPPLIASRRIVSPMAKNSFSRWKNRQVDCFVAASEAIRQILIADGVPAERAVTVHEGIDVGHDLGRLARDDRVRPDHVSGPRVAGGREAEQHRARRQFSVEQRAARVAEGFIDPAVDINDLFIDNESHGAFIAAQTYLPPKV